MRWLKKLQVSPKVPIERVLSEPDEGRLSSETACCGVKVEVSCPKRIRMSASYICPHCGKAVTVKSVPVENCPFCGEPLPETLVDEIERNYLPVRTISLTFQMWLGFIFGFFYALAIPSAFSPPDDSIYKLMGELGYDLPVPPHMPPIFAGILCIVQTAMLLYSSYTLYMNEYKSRYLLMLLVFFFTVPETVITAPMMAGSELGKAYFLSYAFTCILSLTFAYWFLYHWKYCRFYYDSIKYIEAKFKRTNHP